MVRPRKSKSQKIPSFFKVFLPTSSNRMSLPEAFTSYMEGKLPRRGVLRSKGKLWPVGLAKEGDKFFFEDEWDKFVKDHDLKFGDLLFVQFDGDKFFDFKLLDRTGWEDERVTSFPSSINQERPIKLDEAGGSEARGSEEEVREEEVDDEDGEEGGGDEMDNIYALDDDDDDDDDAVFGSGQIRRPRNPYFLASLKDRKRNELHIPKYVLEDFNLQLKDTIFILDEEGRRWESKVVRWQDGQMILTNGWRSFRRWNFVTKDNLCLCEFLFDASGLFLKIQVLHFHDGSWLPKPKS